MKDSARGKLYWDEKKNALKHFNQKKKKKKPREWINSRWTCCNEDFNSIHNERFAPT